jgi:hypothetical protein
MLDARQNGLFLGYPGADVGGPPSFWEKDLDVSQRVEFAGGTMAICGYENTGNWKAIQAVMKIHGEDPNAPSAQQFNLEVKWEKDAASRLSKLPDWSEHIALLHPGQYGYQENRDGNPFLGLVVLFDEKPTDPNQPTGQFHIGFRSLWGHYEPANGKISDKDNYQRFKQWYGPIGNYEPE